MFVLIHHYNFMLVSSNEFAYKEQLHWQSQLKQERNQEEGICFIDFKLEQRHYTQSMGQSWNTKDGFPTPAPKELIKKPKWETNPDTLEIYTCFRSSCNVFSVLWVCVFFIVFSFNYWILNHFKFYWSAWNMIKKQSLIDDYLTGLCCLLKTEVGYSSCVPN